MGYVKDYQNDLWTFNLLYGPPRSYLAYIQKGRWGACEVLSLLKMGGGGGFGHA